MRPNNILPDLAFSTTILTIFPLTRVNILLKSTFFDNLANNSKIHMGLGLILALI